MLPVNVLNAFFACHSFTFTGDYHHNLTEWIQYFRVLVETDLVV